MALFNAMESIFIFSFGDISKGIKLSSSLKSRLLFASTIIFVTPTESLPKANATGYFGLS